MQKMWQKNIVQKEIKALNKSVSETVLKIKDAKAKILLLQQIDMAVAAISTSGSFTFVASGLERLYHQSGSSTGKMNAPLTKFCTNNKFSGSVFHAKISTFVMIDRLTSLSNSLSIKTIAERGKELFKYFIAALESIKNLSAIRHAYF